VTGWQNNKCNSKYLNKKWRTWVNRTWLCIKKELTIASREWDLGIRCMKMPTKQLWNKQVRCCTFLGKRERPEIIIYQYINISIYILTKDSSSSSHQKVCQYDQRHGTASIWGIDRFSGWERLQRQSVKHWMTCGIWEWSKCFRFPSIKN